MAFSVIDSAGTAVPDFFACADGRSAPQKLPPVSCRRRLIEKRELQNWSTEILAIVYDRCRKYRSVRNRNKDAVIGHEDRAEQAELAHCPLVLIDFNLFARRKGRKNMSITPAATLDSVPCNASPIASPAAPRTAIRLVVSSPKRCKTGMTVRITIA